MFITVVAVKSNSPADTLTVIINPLQVDLKSEDECLCCFYCSFMYIYVTVEPQHHSKVNKWFLTIHYSLVNVGSLEKIAANQSIEKVSQLLINLKATF